MKSIHFTLCTILLIAFSINYSSAHINTVDTSGLLMDKVVASVGGELILWSEVQEQVAILKERKQDLGEKTSCAVLQNILVQKLLLNQARIDSVVVSEEEVDSQIEARIDQILGMMNNDVDYFEDYYGMSIDQVRNEFRSDLEEKLLVDRMQAEVVNNVKLTPTEVKEFYATIPKDSLPYFNSEVEYREIVIKPEPSKSSKKAVKDLLEDVKQQIKDGEDFASLATKYSEDPGSAANGGDLGWQKRGSFVPEFEAAAFNLKPNELSPIVESSYGYHLIQLIERRGENINTRHILISPDLADADIDMALAKADSLGQLVSADSISFEYVVRKHSNSKEMSATNGGRVINPATGNTFFEIDQLEPDIYFTLDTLALNQISGAFVDRNNRREKVVRLVQLMSRSDPHQADLSKDYSKIAEATKQQKKAQALNDWVLEKIASTYIDIDERYTKCDNITMWFEEQ